MARGQEIESLLRGSLEQVARGDIQAAKHRALLALQIDPASPRTHAVLGTIAMHANQADEALHHLQASLSTRPGDVETLGNLVAVFSALGKQQGAVPWLQKAIAAEPAAAEPHQMLGNLQRGFGDMENSRASLEAALSLSPENGAYHHELSLMTPYAEGHPHIAAMELLLSRSPDAATLAQLHFALAKAYGDIGRPEAAFDKLVTANSLVRGTFQYDEQNVLDAFANIAKVFSRDFISARRGDTGEAPIFIVGMPRSGTTLVEQILAGHRDIATIGETPTFLRASSGFVRQYPADVPSLTRDQLRAIAVQYLALVRPGAARILDKFLPNAVMVGLIHMVFPRARFIHVIRNPLEACLSCFATHFAQGQPYAYELGELGRYYCATRDLMAHWKSVVPPEVIFEVSYEDVVDDLEGRARAMIAHCGLEWDPACLAFADTARPVWTYSNYQVRQPLYRTSLRRGKPDMRRLQPLIHALGPYGVM